MSYFKTLAFLFRKRASVRVLSRFFI